MGRTDPPNLWRLARRQHGVLAHAQLVAAGLSPRAIRHRCDTGRLRRLSVGVFAVGRLELTQRGRWMAAVLACGPGAALSFSDAARLMAIGERLRSPNGGIEVSVPRPRQPQRAGIHVHRVTLPAGDVGFFERIPVTSPARTLVDLATRLDDHRLEAAVNAADKNDLIDPEELRADLDSRGGQRGVRRLRDLLDRHTLLLTDSELERRFLRIVRQAGLPEPETGVRINGFRVDFLWRSERVVVETDGHRYHRTAITQTRDRKRDHAHFEAGFIPLRFSHPQIRDDPGGVERILRKAFGRVGWPMRR